MIEAGANVITPALLLLGVGTLLHGAWPRVATIATYAVVAWSFLIEVIGALLKANHWILDTSVFHHMRPTPATAPDWWSAGAVLALAFTAACVGVVAFSRRDLSNA
jgi:putative exporter of polyketide antibiotics